MKKLTHLQPNNIFSNKKLPSLVTIFDEVPRITKRYNDLELQTIDNEWRKLQLFKIDDVLKQIKNTDEFWYYLYSLQSEGDFLFKNVSTFVLQILSLPHSSVDCERIFSKVNLTKTKVRNKLQTPALNGLLLSNQFMKKTSCIKFEPTKSMIDSMNVKMYNTPTDIYEEQNQIED